MLQGVDLTDLGWHLTNQVEAVSQEGSLEDMEWLFLFSQYAAGLWLRAIGGPSVLWGRFGGLLIVSANSMMVYSLLRRRFPGERVFLPVLATALLIEGSSAALRFEYFTIPSLLLVAQLWLLDRALAGSGSSKATAYAFALGFLYVPVSMSRLSLALTALLPVVALAYYRIRGRETGALRRILLISLAGLACSAMIAAAALSLTGNLGEYLTEVSDIIAGGRSLPEHEATYLVQKYVTDLRAALVSTTLVILGILLTVVLKDRLGAWRTAVLLLVGLLALGAFILIAQPEVPDIRLRGHGCMLLLGLLTLLAFTVLHFGRGEDLDLDVLILSGFLVMIITPAGSNTGLFKSIYGMWLILPLLYLRLWTMRDSIPCPWVRPVAHHLLWGLLVLLAFSTYLVWTGIYRDNPDRLKLTTPFSHPSLRGTFSTKARVDSLDAVLGAIEEHSSPGDRVLIVNSVPILYYLTETRPILGNPWLFLESLENIREVHEGLAADGDWPGLFCCNKLNSRDWRWPQEGDSISAADAEKLAYLLELYATNPDYALVFEDEAFSVFVRETEEVLVE
jgi:hypothetical protein